MQFDFSIGLLLLHFPETANVWRLKMHYSFSQKVAEMVNFDASEPVVILGFGQMGQVSN